MTSQISLQTVLLILLYMSLPALTRVMKHANTTEPICSNGRVPYANITHTKFYYEINLHSQVHIPLDEHVPHNLRIYWFVRNDLCDSNITGNTFFATIYPNNTFQCLTRDDLSISIELCNKNYNFTRQSMIINNMTDTTISEYTSVYGFDRRTLNLTTARSYMISVSHLTTVDVSTTIFSSTITSKNSSTLHTTNGLSIKDTTSKRPSKSSDLKIILTIVLVVAFVTISTIAGLFYYQYRQRNRRLANYTTNTFLSTKELSSDNQHEDVYCDNATKLDADNEYTIWRPVKQKA